MPDNKDDRGPADRSRINIHEDYEVRYWTKRFGCTADKLRQAVAAVGVSAAGVEAWLRTH